MNDPSEAEDAYLFPSEEERQAAKWGFRIGLFTGFAIGFVWTLLMLVLRKQP
ncbi:hypothetical protein VT84_37725 [Gemmata sp. SH-PL17]|uniref:hypothetical protein n=1 Tax=Gemmata sp. SH-PL17 TaxID=1630693 RepID=UPI00078D9E40|nr:hypothetical protein [Gemmata sp. SH-PL17]AMV30193.1 hypothetical protein VT84_37725 [Gemmata sp. SH-PL17]